VYSTRRRRIAPSSGGKLKIPMNFGALSTPRKGYSLH
jgi:hypothetical protein